MPIHWVPIHLYFVEVHVLIAVIHAVNPFKAICCDDVREDLRFEVAHNLHFKAPRGAHGLDLVGLCYLCVVESGVVCFIGFEVFAAKVLADCAFHGGSSFTALFKSHSALCTLMSVMSRGILKIVDNKLFWL